MSISKRQKERTQENMNTIAAAFGASSGTKGYKRCRGKYAGTVDYYIEFDNGERYYVGNSGPGVSFDEFVAREREQYNPETVRETKEIALKALRDRAESDNAFAQQLGLLPYEVISVELNSTEKNGHMGWYYVVLKVGDNIINHVDTGTFYDILNRKLSDSAETYYAAGGLKDDEPDYVFHGVGFSSKSPLYKMSNDTVFYKMVG